MNRVARFWKTKEHHRFAEFCDACRKYRYIGLCYGVPGIGKTVSARRYANWHRIEPCLSSQIEPAPKLTLSPNQMRTILYTPNIVNTPKRIFTEIANLRGELLSFIFKWYRVKYPDEEGHSRWQQHRKRELVIVDEADRLNMQGFEQIRDIYDHHDLSVVFIGMPGIQKRVARYAQLYSRIGFVHHFEPLDETQMLPVIQHYWQKLCHQEFDPNKPQHLEIFSTLITMTRGNFRLIGRLFAQIERVMEINELDEITREVVEVAREGLVIGI